MSDEYEQANVAVEAGESRKRKEMEAPVAAEGDMELSCKEARPVYECVDPTRRSDP